MLQGMTEVERMQYSQKKLLVRMEIEEEEILEKKREKNRQYVKKFRIEKKEE